MGRGEGSTHQPRRALRGLRAGLMRKPEKSVKGGGKNQARRKRDVNKVTGLKSKDGEEGEGGNMAEQKLSAGNGSAQEGLCPQRGKPRLDTDPTEPRERPSGTVERIHARERPNENSKLLRKQGW